MALSLPHTLIHTHSSHQSSVEQVTVRRSKMHMKSFLAVSHTLYIHLSSVTKTVGGEDSTRKQSKQSRPQSLIQVLTCQKHSVGLWLVQIHTVSRLSQEQVKSERTTRLYTWWSLGRENRFCFTKLQAGYVQGALLSYKVSQIYKSNLLILAFTLQV